MASSRSCRQNPPPSSVPWGTQSKTRGPRAPRRSDGPCVPPRRARPPSAAGLRHTLPSPTCPPCPCPGDSALPLCSAPCHHLGLCSVSPTRCRGLLPRQPLSPPQVTSPCLSPSCMSRDRQLSPCVSGYPLKRNPFPALPINTTFLKAGGPAHGGVQGAGAGRVAMPPRSTGGHPRPNPHRGHGAAERWPEGPLTGMKVTARSQSRQSERRQTDHSEGCDKAGSKRGDPGRHRRCRDS